MVRPEELLGKPFFMRLSAEEVQDFAALLYEKNYAARMNIFEKDTSDPKMYIIKSGSVDILLPKDATYEVVATFYEGDFFGEMSIFDMSPRSATARAIENTALLEISKEDFDRFVGEKPQIAAKILYGMMEEMARRLRKKTLPNLPLF